MIKFIDSNHLFSMSTRGQGEYFMDSPQSKTKTKTAVKKTSSESSTDQPDIKKIYEIATGFWASGALIAAIKLSIFTKLENNPSSSDSLARKLGLNKRWTEKLLTACAAMGMLEKSQNYFSNSPTASQYLVEYKPHYQGAFLLHLGSLWERFGTLANTVQTGARNDSQTTERTDQETSRSWILSSHNVAMSGQAEALAKVLDLRGYKHLCDVGGGPGTYAAVLCLRNSSLKATVLDDPEVVPYAQEIIEASGLKDRVTVKAAQVPFHTYDEEYDVMLISGVLHGFSEATCKKILRKAYKALSENSLVIIQEMLLDDEEAKPLLPALFSLNMTLGETYTASQIMSWLYDIGFVKAEVKEIPDGTWMDHVIIARKP